MSIRYESLDGAVRGFMVGELERDQAAGTLYVSPRLTDAGVHAWPGILREAFEQHDDAWIAQTLRARGLIRVRQRRPAVIVHKGIDDTSRHGPNDRTGMDEIENELLDAICRLACLVLSRSTTKRVGFGLRPQLTGPAPSAVD